MKFLVIGSSVIDHITSDNNIEVKPGGIFYSALGLSSIQNNSHEMFLLTNFDEENYHLFEKPFSKFDMSLSSKVEKVTINNLHLHNDTERDEIYEKLPQALNISPDTDFNMFDAIYINMITGFDITLADLEMIRKNFDKSIYIDIHTLSRGFDENNKRIFRTIPNSERWLKNVNIIQVNETEFSTLSYYTQKEIILDKFFRNGGEGIIITKANKGVEGFNRIGRLVNPYNLEPVKSTSVNSVGCGDVFGSIFFYTYATTQNFETALIEANKYAGKFSDLSNINDFIVNLDNSGEIL